MIYLLYHTAKNGSAAKEFAAPLRHRRNKVFLRDTDAWMMNRDLEKCDCVLLMLAAEEQVPGELIQAYGELDPAPEVRSIAPGQEIWPPNDDERLAMNELNRLREHAALLGIEINPSYDADRLVELIRAAEETEALRKLAEETAANEAAAAADAVASNKVGGGADTHAPSATQDGGASPQGSGATPPSEPDPEAIANADALVALAAVNRDDPAALREFATKHGVPVSPNPKVGADKLLAAIRTKLGG